MDKEIQRKDMLIACAIFITVYLYYWLDTRDNIHDMIDQAYAGKGAVTEESYANAAYNSFSKQLPFEPRVMVITLVETTLKTLFMSCGLAVVAYVIPKIGSLIYPMHCKNKNLKEAFMFYKSHDTFEDHKGTIKFDIEDFEAAAAAAAEAEAKKDAESEAAAKEQKAGGFLSHQTDEEKEEARMKRDEKKAAKAAAKEAAAKKKKEKEIDKAALYNQIFNEASLKMFKEYNNIGETDYADIQDKTPAMYFYIATRLPLAIIGLIVSFLFTFLISKLVIPHIRNIENDPKIMHVQADILLFINLALYLLMVCMLVYKKIS